MKVIMLKDLKGVGKRSEIVNVKDGYAQNFLIPRGFAVMQSDKSLEILGNQKQAEAEEIERLKEKARDISQKLKDITLEFTAKGSGDGRMFGTISTKQIAEELKAKHGIEIDKRKIVSKVQADHFGYTKLDIELYKGIMGTITVHVSESK